MRCPACHSDDLRVLETRELEAIRRELDALLEQGQAARPAD